MAKSFKGLISKNQELKKESNLETENDRLREKIKQFENEQSKDISLIKLSDLKLSSNIRQDDFGYNYEEIEVLAHDIEKNGQLQPILISKDNYLIAGFRRYHAILYLAENEKAIDEILAYTYYKKYSDICDEDLIDIQLAENFQRREIDNFQLSKLYHEMISNGYNQQKLAEKFKKSKSFISMVLSISKIDFELVKLLKQFQVFGCSEQKFNALNFSPNTDEKVLFEYENLKNLIGITSLNKIAKCENIKEQKQIFLKTFKKRLTDEELNSNYFKDVSQDKNSNEISNVKISTAINKTKALSKVFNSLFEDLSEDSKKHLYDINKSIAHIEKLLNKIQKEI